MVSPQSLHDLIREGKYDLSRERVRALLATGSHPIQILHDSIVPLLEQSAREFSSRTFHVAELPAFARALKQLLRLLSPSVHSGTIALRIAIGPAQFDTFDLWRSTIRQVFTQTGFETSEIPARNSVRVLPVCSLLPQALEQMRLSQGRAPGMRGRFGQCAFASTT